MSKYTMIRKEFDRLFVSLLPQKNNTQIGRTDMHIASFFVSSQFCYEEKKSVIESKFLTKIEYK